MIPTHMRRCAPGRIITILKLPEMYYWAVWRNGSSGLRLHQRAAVVLRSPCIVNLSCRRIELVRPLTSVNSRANGLADDSVSQPVAGTAISSDASTTCSSNHAEPAPGRHVLLPSSASKTETGRFQQSDSHFNLIAQQAPSVNEAIGSFLFCNWAGPPVRVLHWVPPASTSCKKLLFVIHGVRRNADDYIKAWLSLAQANNFAVVAPHFSLDSFPTDDEFQLGNTADPTGRCQCPSLWAYSLIEPLFDQLLQAYPNLTTSSYALYGHSAGAQFVHRFVLHVPQARCTLAMAANAGWYTMPNLTAPWPYGLQGSALVAELGDAWQQSLQKPLTLLLGDQDIDPNDKNLRNTPEAVAQGPCRFARGLAFHAAGSAAAELLDLECIWQLVVVSGANHSSKKMMPAAVQLLLQQQQQHAIQSHGGAAAASAV